MRLTALLATTLIGITPLLAESVTLEASADATLIEDAGGARANGSGPAFFVGRTGEVSGARRRALLRFDVAGALPRSATVQRVTLKLFMTPSHPEPRMVRVHRVLSGWGEGPSASSGGGGGPSEPGDVTWLHTFYDTRLWIHEGGHFVKAPSALAVLAEEGPYAIEDAGGLARDVRIWAAAPERNFGWILLGDESALRSVKSFASREDPDAALRPRLTIEYRLPGGRPAE